MFYFESGPTLSKLNFRIQHPAISTNSLLTISSLVGPVGVESKTGGLNGWCFMPDPLETTGPYLHGRIEACMHHPRSQFGTSLCFYSRAPTKINSKIRFHRGSLPCSDGQYRALARLV